MFERNAGRYRHGFGRRSTRGKKAGEAKDLMMIAPAAGDTGRPSVGSLLEYVRKAIGALLEKRLIRPLAAGEQAAYETLTRLETELLLVEFGSGDRDCCPRPEKQASA
jgi:hypothetical protein